VNRAVRFHALAEIELNEAADFYDLESPGLGGAFLAEIERTLTQIVEFPEAVAAGPAGIRRWLLVKFPFALLYSLPPDEIRILAVAHLKRRPFYWRGRE